MQANTTNAGNIYNIQQFSLQDGPGIRTTVFLKGCPLSCDWCSNPESQNAAREIIYRESLCAGCRKCIEACEIEAIKFLENEIKIRIDRDKCNLCMKCIEACVRGALNSCGEIMSLETVFEKVMKDFDFYSVSKGGVTASGGEPLSQADFVFELFKKCKEKGIHTTLDTSGYGNASALEKLLSVTDLILFDIKIMNAQKHREFTGVINDLILENLKLAVENNQKIIIRIPLIPGITDPEENIVDIARFVSKLGKVPVNILPYHELGVNKYKMLDRQYQLADLKTKISVSQLERVKEIFKEYGLECKTES